MLAWRRSLGVAGIVATIVAWASVAHAGALGLAWDPSDGASGYRIRYGTTAGNYPNARDVGSVTETVLTGLPDCATLYFVVSAYNAAGESGFSNEVASLARPIVSNASPGALEQGASGTVRIAGSNFEPGATVAIDNPNVFLSGIAVTSCNEIQMIVTVEPTSSQVRPAQIGKFSVRVDTPGGLTVTQSQAFEVMINPFRFDVNQSDDVTKSRIDGKDTVWLARMFGLSEAQATYDPDFDFTGDGWIDGDDLAYLASNLGRCWTGTAWSVAACPPELR